MYPQSHRRSEQLHERARAYMPGGNTRSTLYMKPFPIYAARGEGCRIWDVDGNEFIDCGNNFTALIHGHAHPALTKVSAEQLPLGTASACRRSRKSTWLSCSPAVFWPSNRSGSLIPEQKL
jgi:glutamate-1-semialdehyde 2,1-aminomutase